MNTCPLMHVASPAHSSEIDDNDSDVFSDNGEPRMSDDDTEFVDDISSTVSNLIAGKGAGAKKAKIVAMGSPAAVAGNKIIPSIVKVSHEPYPPKASYRLALTTFTHCHSALQLSLGIISDCCAYSSFVFLLPNLTIPPITLQPCILLANESSIYHSKIRLAGKAHVEEETIQVR